MKGEAHIGPGSEPFCLLPIMGYNLGNRDLQPLSMWLGWCWKVPLPQIHQAHGYHPNLSIIDQARPLILVPWEAEVGGSQVEDWPGLQSVFTLDNLVRPCLKM